MNNRLLLCLALGFASCGASSEMVRDDSGYDKSIACSYGLKKPMTSGEAKLFFKGGKVNRIHFNNYYPGGRGQLGFTCLVDLTRQDASLTWLDEGSRITVTSKESEDTLQLRQDKKGYRLDFSKFKTLSRYCGAGAELPVEVFIPVAGKPCKARLPQVPG